MTTLTANRLRHLIRYDADNGEFYYLNRFHKKFNHQAVRAKPNKQGYLMISIDGCQYQAHRLAWLYVTGAWPEKTVDHKDLDKANNRWSNLREASRSQQKANMRKRSDSTSPFKGVYWGRRQKKWGAHIGCRGVRRHLGYFDTAQKAHAAYAAAAERLFGEFARAA